MKKDLEIQFWGTRGSMAAPYPDRMCYGGNTSCVSAKWGSGMVIFDAGTGIRELGMHLIRELQNQKELHIFISHMHLDHIIGIPFFPLLFLEDWTVHFYGMSRNKEEFEKKLKRFMDSPYWPISFQSVSAKVVFHEVNPDKCVQLSDEVQVHMMEADHPNGSLMYRMKAYGVSVVYGLDCEVTETMYAPYCAFAKDCDLLIFDGMYTETEYSVRKGYGHGTWQQGVEISGICGAKKLCISHHDWGRTDQELEQLEKIMKKRKTEAFFAREGMKLCLRE